MNDIEKLLKFEQDFNTATDLLKIAKSYCEHNYDKASEVNSLGTMLEIILDNHKCLSNQLDKILYCK